MKKILVLMMALTLGSGCSSQKAAEKAVDKKAEAVTPVIDVQSQYDRAVAMVRADKDLKAEQKEKLVGVLNTYAKKSREIKLKQSQFRAVLVKELLNSGEQKNPKVEAAMKNLTRLDDESSRDLGKFIRDFKFHSGNFAGHMHPMREMIRFH